MLEPTRELLDEMIRAEIVREFFEGARDWAREQEQEQAHDAAYKTLVSLQRWSSKPAPILALALTQFFEGLRFWQREQATKPLREECLTRSDHFGFGGHWYCRRMRWHSGECTLDAKLAEELDAPLRAAIAARLEMRPRITHLLRLLDSMPQESGALDSNAEKEGNSL